MKKALADVIYTLILLITLAGITAAAFLSAGHYPMAILCGLCTLSLVMLLCNGINKLHGADESAK